MKLGTWLRFAFPSSPNSYAMFLAALEPTEPSGSASLTCESLYATLLVGGL
jgi:hypothetical protein